MKSIIPAIGRRLRRLRHPFSRWQRFYVVENPWHLERPSEVYRYEETNRIIREAIGPVASILEIGAAEGHQTKWLLNLAPKVRAIEISSNAVKRARRTFANDPNVSFSVGSLPDIRIEERFDLVTAFEVIYYVKPKDIPRALDSIERLAPRRLVSVHWPHVHLLETFLFPTRDATREVLTWEGKPMWLFAWW